MEQIIERISNHIELQDQRQGFLQSKVEKQGDKIENMAKESMLYLN